MTIQLSQMLVQEACRRLVQLGARLADAGEHEAFAALFAEHATLLRPSGETLKGKAQILASYRRKQAERLTTHLIFDTLFTEVAEERASGTTQVQLWSATVADEVGQYGRPARGRIILGEFADVFVLTDSGWRIEHRKARFDMFHDL